MFCCTNKRLILLAILGLAIVLGLAYFFRWQIVLDYAPFLLILLCPLMHLLGGHGGHGDNSDSAKKDAKRLSCH